MIVDITNEIYTTLKNSLTGITVLATYPATTPKFPCVIVEEISNNTNTASIDTSGEKYNDVSIEINIFSQAKDKISEAKLIRNQIDSIMSGSYRMDRVFSNVVPNYIDTNVYRYVLRYECTVNSNKQIHRR